MADARADGKHSHSISLSYLKDPQGPNFPIKKSRSLQSDGVKEWLVDSRRAEELLNIILAIIHPDLYQNAHDALKALQANPEASYAHRWASVFSGISVISNRITPPHKDRSSDPRWYDILSNLGNFEQSYLDLVDLGAHFLYKKGTVIPFCGNLLKHAVQDWGRGDRICYAHFMRKGVISQFTESLAGWMTTAKFEETVGYYPVKS